MAFTKRTITPDELKKFSHDMIEHYHPEHIDEPHPGAGYCVCEMCQEYAPRFFVAAEEIEKLRAENERLKMASKRFLDFCNQYDLLDWVHTADEQEIIDEFVAAIKVKS